MKYLIVGSRLTENDGPGVFCKNLKENLEIGKEVTYASRTNFFKDVFFKQFDYDIVILNSNNLLPLFCLLRILFSMRKCNIYTIVHGEMGKELAWSIKKVLLLICQYWCLVKSKKLIFVSELFKNDFFKHRNVKYKSKALVIHNGVSQDLLNEVVVKNKSERVLIYAGGLRDEKGFNLIESFIKDYRFPTSDNFTIYLIGMKREYICQQDNVKFVYCNKIKHSDFIALLNKAEILLSPSKYETFGIALLEAYCLKCKVVTYKLAGALELLSQKNNVYIFDDYNLDGFFKQIDSVINNDYIEDDEQYGQYNWVSTINNLVAIFQSDLNINR